MALTKSRHRMTAGAPVSVLDYGAALDGTTDDTAAWQAALATGRPVYFPEGASVITEMLTLSDDYGAGIIGSGRYSSRFLVDSTTFDMAADGVVKLGAIYQTIRDVGFTFTQPDTAVRANVKQYPPAIEMAGNGRAEISRILIEAGYAGINGQGNCGGSVIQDVQCGCLFAGLVLDGALDSIRVNDWHYWPFGIAHLANLYLVYSDGNNIACDFGRVDDIKINNLLTFRGRVRFVDHGSGSTFGQACNVALDSDYGRLEFEAGEMVMTGVNGSTGTANDYVLLVSGGELKISGFAPEAGLDLNFPLVHVSGGTFVCSDIHATMLGTATAAFRVSGGVMHLSNGFVQAAASNRTVGLVDIIGGRATVTGLRASDSGGSTGDFIYVGVDGYHVVTDNCALGWAITVPATKVYGLYGPNTGTPTGTAGSDHVGAVMRRRYTGTLDGSGDATVVHGITNAHTRMIGLHAHYTTGPGVRYPFVPEFIDAANISLAAGAPGAGLAYTCWLTYV